MERIERGPKASGRPNEPIRATTAHPGGIRTLDRHTGLQIERRKFRCSVWCLAIGGSSRSAASPRSCSGSSRFVWPGPTLAVLVLLFGAYAFVDGVALLVALARGDVLARQPRVDHGADWARSASSSSIVTLLWPGMTALTLLYLVAIWAIAMGILQITAAIEFRREIDGEFFVVLGGIFSIVFGGLLVAFPGAGLLSLVWLVGHWAELFGLSSLGIAYRLHGIGAALPKVVKLGAAHLPASGPWSSTRAAWAG